MKKIKIALLLPMLLTLMSTLGANAACIPHQVAEGAVAGRTYVLKSSPNSRYPNYLTFGSSRDLNASYGSALDGRPVGRYHFHGNCHGEVIVTFTSDFGWNPAPQEVFQLRPMDSKYFQLRSADGKIFKIVTDI